MKANSITTEVVDSIMESIATDDGIIDVPQGDEGAFRKLCYYSDPDEIIPMEVYGNREELTFQILCPEHAKQYGSRIAPFLYGVVRSLVNDLELYPYGRGSYAELDDKGSISFVIYEENSDNEKEKEI